MRSVRDRLKPNGAFAMYNYYREPWLIDRLAGTVAKVFGHAPCVDTWADRQAAISIGVSQAGQKCQTSWTPSPEGSVSPATDDAPFLYFKGDGFPKLYLVALLGILLASLLTVRRLGGPFREMRPYADLFFMGAAFLLLETKNVATFALIVRYHLVRERSGVCRRADYRAGCGRNDPQSTDSLASHCLRGHRSLTCPRLGDPSGMATTTALRPSAALGHAFGIPADLFGEYRIRQALPAFFRFPSCIRYQFAWRARRRLP